MKRVILLILALLLLGDLAVDGQLGKAKFVDSQSSAKTCLNSSQVDGSGKFDSRDALPSQAGKIPRLLQFQAVMSLVPPALKIISFTSIGSSGGIPL